MDDNHSAWSYEKKREKERRERSTEDREEYIHMWIQPSEMIEKGKEWKKQSILQMVSEWVVNSAEPFFKPSTYSG